MNIKKKKKKSTDIAFSWFVTAQSFHFRKTENNYVDSDQWDKERRGTTGICFLDKNSVHRKKKKNEAGFLSPGSYEIFFFFKLWDLCYIWSNE